MRKFFERLLILITIALACFAAGWIFIVEPFYDKYDFYVHLGQSGANFRLKDYNCFDWDEVAIVKPYSSYCDLGIEDYPKDMSNCPRSTDDGEQRILFLMNNAVVRDFNIARSKFNVSADDVPTRIKREHAIFKRIGNSIYQFSGTVSP